MADSFLCSVAQRQYDFEIKQDLKLKSFEVIYWIEENFDYWVDKKKMGDKLGDSFQNLDLIKFTNDALLYAKENSLRFWECIDFDEDGIIGLNDIEMMDSSCCQIFCPHIQYCLGINQFNGNYDEYYSHSE